MMTPGPWHMKNKPYPDGKPYITLGAVSRRWREGDHHGLDWSNYDAKSGDGFHIAGIMSEDDARLIVAAPDTYAALKEVRVELKDARDSLFETCTLRDDASTLEASDRAEIERVDAIIARVDAALAKAEGRQP